MILTTWDLHDLSLCSKKWKEDKEDRSIFSPSRELLKKLFLHKSLGKGRDWSLKEISKVWDEVFWKGKDLSRENITESIRGLYASKKLYDKLPSGDFIASPAKILSKSIDSSIILFSAGDFILSYDDRIEVWIYGKKSLNSARRTSQLTAESWLVQSSLRRIYKKEIHCIWYWIDEKTISPKYTRCKCILSQQECEKIIIHLCNIAQKEIFFPTQGELCKSCKVNC